MTVGSADANITALKQSLDQIGLVHGTDKTSKGNDFLNRYEFFVHPIRHKQVNVLEIGVFGGASVRTWKDYFRNGKIIGADINPDVKQYAADRISIEIIDQGNEKDLEHLASLGPFDLIIDDGSHMWKHQILTLRKLLQSVKPGGYFIIEDLDTSHGKYIREYGSLGYLTATEYIQKLSDWVVGSWVLDSTHVQDEFMVAMGRSIEFITFTRGAAIIKMRS